MWMKRQGWPSLPLSARRGGLEQALPSQPSQGISPLTLDFELLASRTLRQHISVVYVTQMVVLCQDSHCKLMNSHEWSPGLSLSLSESTGFRSHFLVLESLLLTNVFSTLTHLLNWWLISHSFPMFLVFSNWITLLWIPVSGPASGRLLNKTVLKTLIYLHIAL